ncbi:MAG: hypothetical protein KAU35_07430 [candidate division Zixibacteria bacterium]|nr:hypothetical protein [candidate division Zixibacteria bacterium]
MNNLESFDLEYFTQSRKEIDTEKRERDHLLNFAVIILGALCFSFIRSADAQGYLISSDALYLVISALVIVTSLFWVRWKKLQQIADRWFVLNRMLVRKYGQEFVKERLEGIAVEDLKTRRYIMKDLVLNYALSFPFYGLLLSQCMNASDPSWTFNWLAPLAIIALHVGVSAFIFRRKFADPLPGMEDSPEPTNQRDEKPA